jgi:multidrug efflux pump subunit AcrB
VAGGGEPDPDDQRAPADAAGGDRRARLHPGLTRRYGRLLRWSLEHRGKALMAIVLIVGVSLVPAKHVKFDMFGEDPGKEMGMYLNWKGSYSLEQMSDEIAKIERHLDANRKRYHLKQVYVFYAEQGWGGFRLTLNDDKGVDPKAIQELMRTELPKLARAEIGFQGSNDQGKGGNEVQFYLTGDSSEELGALGEGLLPLLSKRKELRDVRIDSGDENSEVQVTVNRERAKPTASARRTWRNTSASRSGAAAARVPPRRRRGAGQRALRRRRAVPHGGHVQPQPAPRRRTPCR